MALMEIRQLIKRISSPMPVISVCTALLFALCYLIIRSLSDDSAGQLHFWVIVVGCIGVVVLSFFLLTNFYSLFRQLVRNEIGSKLTSKLVIIYLILTLIPFSLIYFFSIQFLNKGVDSWFDVRIEQAVQDALLLGQSSLEAIKHESVSDVENYAKSLAKNLGRRNLLRLLDDIRELEDYAELAIYTQDGRIIAYSSNQSSSIVPDTPNQDVFADLRLNQTYTSIEPLSDNSQKLRIVAPVRSEELGQTTYALQAIKLLPLRYAELASSVESALNQYKQMQFARGPLKFSLIVTLSLISLASLLFSMLAAVYLSKRLVAPISELAAGTRKIAEGDYGTTLPITSSDELGILLHSFNNMSQKIGQAQNIAFTSQQETEAQKSYLEGILTNLSSGVFSFDENKKLQIVNSAASEILGLELQTSIGLTPEQLETSNATVKPFFQLIEKGMNSKQSNWQDEINLLGSHGRQMLILRGTLLDLAATGEHSTVVVFDDMTNLIQAQRDAAWGEVARRLAHEIKNPLTPIQLSAERIHDKFLNQLPEDLRPALERSTRTIVQQVESMKEMVNAFSSYAQPVRAQLSQLDLNRLINDILDLHSSIFEDTVLNIQLDQQLPLMTANASALRQVLNNLLINASHALEDADNPQLSISTALVDKALGNYIDIRIQDNGQGIPDEIRDSLFDPYVSSKAKGSGLGLAIVKRIVEEHGGSVWVEDNQPSGTCLCLRIPINAMQTYRGNRSQNALQSKPSQQTAKTVEAKS